MKTQSDVSKLKESWLNDPCWDIEDSEGFEEYHDELLAFRKEQEMKWEIKNQAKRNALASLFCPMSYPLPNENMHCQLEKCAWWDSNINKCAIATLPEILLFKNEIIENMGRK